MSHRRARAGGGKPDTKQLGYTCFTFIAAEAVGGGGVLFLSSPPPNKGQERERAGERHHSIIPPRRPFSDPNLPYSLPPSFSLCVALFRAILRCICAAWRLTLEGTKKVRKKDPRFAIIASH